MRISFISAFAVCLFAIFLLYGRHMTTPLSWRFLEADTVKILGDIAVPWYAIMFPLIFWELKLGDLPWNGDACRKRLHHAEAFMTGAWVLTALTCVCAFLYAVYPGKRKERK